MQYRKLIEILLLLLFFTGCQISGEYSYEKEGVNERQKNETVLTYKGKINEVEYKVKNKVNFDISVPDKPPYYETSYELWFW